MGHTGTCNRLPSVAGLFFYIRYIAFSAAHFILDRLPSCSVTLSFEPSTVKIFHLRFIIIQFASNVNADQDEGDGTVGPPAQNRSPPRYRSTRLFRLTCRAFRVIILMQNCIFNFRTGRTRSRNNNTSMRKSQCPNTGFFLFVL